MARVEDGRRRLAVALGGALMCALFAASHALAAPTVSPGDGVHWGDAAPLYMVTPDGSAAITWGIDGRRESGGPIPSPSDPTPISLPGGLPEGDWTLRIRQDGQTVTRAFVIDRTAPGPLTPSGPASVVSGQSATFTWTGGEADARYVWRVRTTAGAPVTPPAEAGNPTATVPPLAAGAYEVVVAQIDLAGNAGPEASARLTVAPVPPPVTPAVVAPPLAPAVPALPVPRSPVVVTIKLPSSHPRRMTPRRAAVVRTVRPMLRWKGAPKGTTLYNVQIFRVDDRRAASSRAVALKKLRSVFPRTNRMRTPRLRRGACYVWRVWPYRGEDFTKRPLGVSNFCVAKARRSARR